MPRRNTIEINIEGQNNASDELNAVSSSLGDFGNGLDDVFAGLQLFTSAMDAAVNAFAEPLRQFSEFDTSMREVFTVLPDISDQSMRAMTEDVKEFAAEMGIIPDELVPAMYEALSAGVPQDNIFDFMTVAQMAAVGGVTELETAVDGITSVINAYGADTLSAGDATDLMFEAVRLGKTTFDELANSLYNVIPTAAGLDVAFSDVTAGLAAITAQGTPTSVATTQMRDLLNQLSQSGGEAAVTFESLAGESFRDFIEGGGDLQGALQLMEAHANDLNVGIGDLFGSVEAGNAALALTGQGTEFFTQVLAEMEDASGATQAAYEMMDAGIARATERVQAKLELLTIGIGEFLAPAFAALLDAVSPVLDILNLIIGALNGEYTSGWMDIFGMYEDSPLPVFLFELGDAFKAMTRGVAPFTALAEAVLETVQQLESYGEITPETAATIRGLIAAVDDIFDAVSGWLAENIQLSDVLIVIGGVIASIVVPAIVSIIAAAAPVVALFAGLVLAVSAIRQAWETDWGGIRTIVTDVWTNTLQPAIERLVGWFTGEIPNALGAAGDAFGGLDLESIARTIFETVIPALADIVVWFLDNIPNAVTIIVAVWNQILLPIFTELWRIITTVVIPALSDLWDWLQTAIPAAVEWMSTAWNTVLLPALQGLVDWYNTSAKPVVDALIAWLEDDIPRAVQWASDAWTNTLQPAFDTVRAFVDTYIVPMFEIVFDWLKVQIPAAIRWLVSKFDDLMDVLDDIKQGFQDVIQGAIDLASNPIVGGVLGAFGGASLQLLAQQQNTPQFGTGAIVTAPTRAIVGDGLNGTTNRFEGIFNEPQLRALIDEVRGSAGMVVNFYGGNGAPRNQQEADDSAFMLRGAMKRRGYN